MLEITTKIINKIKTSDLLVRKFTILCEKNNSPFTSLLWYNHVRWLSKGMMLNRFHILFKELKEFFLDIKLNSKTSKEKKRNIIVLKSKEEIFISNILED